MCGARLSLFREPELATWHRAILKDLCAGRILGLNLRTAYTDFLLDEGILIPRNTLLGIMRDLEKERRFGDAAYLAVKQWAINPTDRVMLEEKCRLTTLAQTVSLVSFLRPV